MAKERLIDFAERAGIARSFACQIIHRRRIPTVNMSLQIYDKTGRKFGLLEGATLEEIAAVRRMVNRTGLSEWPLAVARAPR